MKVREVCFVSTETGCKSSDYGECLLYKRFASGTEFSYADIHIEKNQYVWYSFCNRNRVGRELMFDEYLQVFRAFTDENRLQILELLCSGEKCACVLLENLKISQPTLSHHMKILCKSGIVKSRRVGPWNYYSINEDGCEYASHLLQVIAQKKLQRTLKIAGIFQRIFFCFKKRPAEPFSSVCECTKRAIQEQKTDKMKENQEDFSDV